MRAKCMGCITVALTMTPSITLSRVWRFPIIFLPTFVPSTKTCAPMQFLRFKDCTDTVNAWSCTLN